MKIGKSRRRRIVACYYQTKAAYEKERAPQHKLNLLLAWHRCFGNFEMVFGPETEEWEKERLDLAFAHRTFTEKEQP